MTKSMIVDDSDEIYAGKTQSPENTTDIEVYK